MTEGLQDEMIGFGKGIVRTPSVGESGEMSEMVNLISKNGELVNIVPPNTVVAGGDIIQLPSDEAVLMTIHNTTRYTNYIYRVGKTLYAMMYDKDEQKFVDNEVEIAVLPEEDFKVITCGNVLAVYGTGINVSYYLYNKRKYDPVLASYDTKKIRLGLKADLSRTEMYCGDDGNRKAVYHVHEKKERLLYDGYSYTGMSTISTTHNINKRIVGEDYIRVRVDESTYINASISVRVHLARDIGISGSEYEAELKNGEYADFHIAGQEIDNIQLFIVEPGEKAKTKSLRIRVHGLDGVTRSDYRAGYYSNAYTSVVGVYNSFHAYAKKADKFSNPFMARIAFRLVTGEVVSPSAPIYMSMSDEQMPSIEISHGGELGYYIVGSGPQASLCYMVDSSLVLSNMIESVVIGVSLQIHPVSSDVEQDRVFISKSSVIPAYYDIDGHHNSQYVSDSTLVMEGYAELPRKKDIEEQTVGASTFRIVKEIKVTDLVYDQWTDVVLKPGTLEAIEGESEDFMTIKDGRSGVESFSASVAFSYNGRLSFSNLVENHRPGYTFNELSAYKKIVRRNIGVVVTLALESGDKTIVIPSTESELSVSIFKMWFYYPDSRAVKADIYLCEDNRDGFGKATIGLRAHPFLSGAYYFGDIDFDYDLTNKGRYKSEWEILSSEEYITREENKYITSALNQPLVPDAITGYIGSGEILGVSTATKALSQGQFGQFPLQFFCTDGIWAVSIGSDGSYQTTTPVTRDVLTNPDGLVQTDGAVIFPTAHGLKVLQGSDTAVLSTNVHGLNIDESAFLGIDGYESDKGSFLDQIQGAKVLYDYVNQLLHVFVRNTDGTFSNVHYVYSMESQQWSKQWLTKDCGGTELNGTDLKAIIPGYPYSTMQFGNTLYQYSSTPDVTVREGFFLTRPLTLGSPVTRKAIWDLRVIGQRTSGNTKFAVKIFASNDNVHWRMVTSLKTGSAKYYRLMIRCNLTDIDTLSGVVMRYLEKWNHKLF